MRSAVATVLDVAAVARVTRLVTTDTLTAPVREFAIEAAYAGRDGYAAKRDLAAEVGSWRLVAEVDGPTAPRAAYVWTCDWCASVWVGAGVALARRVPGWSVLRFALASSLAAGWLGNLDAGHRVGHG